MFRSHDDKMSGNGHRAGRQACGQTVTDGKISGGVYRGMSICCGRARARDCSGYDFWRELVPLPVGGSAYSCRRLVEWRCVLSQKSFERKARRRGGGERRAVAGLGFRSTLRVSEWRRVRRRGGAPKE